MPWRSKAPHGDELLASEMLHLEVLEDNLSCCVSKDAREENFAVFRRLQVP